MRSSPWLIWTAGFLAFPIAGVAGGAVAGRVDNPIAALMAGLITGAVIGTGQWLVSSGRLRPGPWILATALGMGAGLLLGATAVGFGTSLADVAVMGALTGVALGVAQTLVLPARTRPALVVGGGDAAVVGARLDRHHPGRNRRGGAVHHLRRQRCRHLLRPLRRPPAPPPRSPTARPPVTDPTLARPATASKDMA